MIAASILFILPQNTNWDEIATLAKNRAEHLYQNYPGLQMKAFVLNKETGEYGGLYIWESQVALDNFLASDVFKTSKEKFGTPIIKTFDLLAHIENGKLKE
jgi:heme-degrading monooxygenase HmoA